VTRSNKTAGGDGLQRASAATFDAKEEIAVILDKIKDLPIARDVDVLVIGGGPAGIGAALAAARNGAKTLVVEQFNCLGGVATAGGHGHISKYDEEGTAPRLHTLTSRWRV
jgi:ribulose 1,5-bisphosphate synthetase/thiazole synthase